MTEISYEAALVDIGKYANHLTQVTLEDLCDFIVKAGIGEEGIERLKRLSFFHAPASAGHHGAKIGGLCEHSVIVTRRLLSIGQAIGVGWEDRRSPYVIGLLHDICKCSLYTWAMDGTVARTVSAIPGHGVHSAIVAPTVTGRPLTPQETVGIVHHMGAWTTDRDTPISNLDAAVRTFPRTVIAVHAADMMASQVDENPDTIGRRV